MLIYQPIKIWRVVPLRQVEDVNSTVKTKLISLRASKRQLLLKRTNCFRLCVCMDNYESNQEGKLLERLRLETPGVQHVVHFNNAGCSLPPKAVLDAQVKFLQLEASIGGYEAVDQQSDLLNSTYTALASLLNCAPSELAIVQSATLAWSTAFYGIRFQAGDKILTCEAEYGSNFIAFLQVCERSGAEVEVIPNDSAGQMDVNALRRKLQGPGGNRVRLVAVTHIPTSTGVVNPVAEIGRVANEAGVLYLVDACQSVGQMPVDVQAIGCDFLSGTGRKYLRGPRGTGFLYARRSTMDSLQLAPGFVDNWGAKWTGRGCYNLEPTAQRFETYETSFAAKAGLAVAVNYVLELGIDSIWTTIQRLASELRHQLDDLPGVTVHDQGTCLCGIVSFTKMNVCCETVRKICMDSNVNVSVSRRPSTRVDFENRGLEEVVRASVHYYNTEDELLAFVGLISEM